MTGLILELQRFSVNDGPGIRTTVFLKGCPLRCLWCHNPESMSPVPEISYNAEKCRACGNCAREQPHCHRMEAGRHVFDRAACDADAPLPFCPGGALVRLGRWRESRDILEEVLKDKAFYEASGGGLTLSGGEPMLQFEFTLELLRAAKAQGLHCCLDTSGFADFEKYAQVLPFVDLFLYDIKETDPERHRAYTGVSNARILENLRLLDARGAKTILRCPIIPTLNERSDHFAGIASIANSLKNVVQIDLMPFHPWGRSKAHYVGRAYALDHLGAVTDETADAWVKELRALTDVPVFH